MFGKYEFAGRYEVQFVLAGLRIDTDTQCGGESTGDSGDSGGSDYSEDSKDSDYSEDSEDSDYIPDYYEDGSEEGTDQEQEDTENTEETYSVFDKFLGQFYNEDEDEDWIPDVE